MIMTHWLMRFTGRVFPAGCVKGFCIMTETDRHAYETAVRNYFLTRKRDVLLIGDSNIVRWETEGEFWNCVKWVPVTTEETHILSELDLNDYGIYPSQEDFEYEIH